MKVYSIYINDTDAHFIVCSPDEEAAEQLLTNDEDSPLFESDMAKERVEVYTESHLSTDLTEPTIISWMIQEHVNF